MNNIIITNSNYFEMISQSGKSKIKVSEYLKTPEALWRLLATYPKRMPVADAIRRARIDFTKCRKEVAV